MPDPIETRPFTIHPELYAWPSFRMSAERVAWVYGVLFVAVSFLIKTGMQLSWPLALLAGAGIVGAAFALAFGRHRMALGAPRNRGAFQGVVVRLDDDGLRQDYPDGSFLEMKNYAITSLREMGPWYVVLATPKHRIVVLKTAFDSPEQSREFATRIRRILEKPAQPQ